MNQKHYDHMRIVRLREKAGLSKAELAEELGVTLMTIYRVESGAHCSIDLLVRLAARFDLDWRDLLLPQNSKKISANG